MKTVLTVALLILMAAALVFGARYYRQKLDQADQAAKAKIEELASQAETLQSDLDKALKSAQESAQVAADAEKQLAQAQTHTEQVTEALKAKIRHLEEVQAGMAQDTEDQVEAISSLEDSKLADILNVQIPEGNIFHQADLGFVFDRPAAETVSAAFVRLPSTIQQLGICEQKAQAFQDGWKQTEELAQAFQVRVTALEAHVENQDQALAAAQVLEANQLQRLEAQAGRMKTLERKLMWSKVGTTVGVAGGLAVGVFLGRAFD